MMGNLETFDNILLEHGLALDGINPGSVERAVQKVWALEALSAIAGSNLCVLGGDVLRLKDGKLEYVYENWFSKKMNDEDDVSYALRSQQEAMQYIGRFPQDKFDPYFVLVIRNL